MLLNVLMISEKVKRDVRQRQAFHDIDIKIGYSASLPP